MSDNRELRQLAELIRQRNEVERDVTSIIKRPMQIGHVGEFIASRIFNIELHESATHKGSDGYFVGGPFDGQSVNIKFYGRNEGILDMNIKEPPDFYLALAGPRTSPASSRDLTRPWTISSVFLFNHQELVSRLTVKLGTATSIKRQFWDTAEIYPTQNNPMLPLTQLQRAAIGMFNDDS